MSSPTEPARRALRRARLARVLSWAAVAAGLGFIVAFLAQAGLFSVLEPKAPQPVPQMGGEQIAATQSTVTGIDKDKQPYEVRARRGWQDEKEPALVHLEAPEGVFRRAQGAEYRISGDTGLYDTRDKTLALTGNVLLEQRGRFTARMERANVVVAEKRLTSEGPVSATFGTGTVDANGLQITDDGGRILFLNGVTARFEAPDPKGDMNP